MRKLNDKKNLILRNKWILCALALPLMGTVHAENGTTYSSVISQDPADLSHHHLEKVQPSIDETLTYSFYAGKARQSISEMAQSYKREKPTFSSISLQETLIANRSLLTEAMAHLQTMHLDQAAQQNMIRGLDQKIEKIKKTQKQFESTTDLSQSLMMSFLGARLSNQVKDLEKNIQKALGSLSTEFNGLYGPFDGSGALDALVGHMRLEKALAFLEMKKKNLQENTEKSFLKQAAESLLQEKLGLTDFSIEETLIRGTGSDKELAGVILYNKEKAEAIILLADGTTQALGLMGRGSAKGGNIGLDGKAYHFARYGTFHDQIVNTTERLIQDSQDQGKTLNVVTLGEKIGSADALQAAYNIKDIYGDAVTVKSIGSNAMGVYENLSAQQVEKVLGKENIIIESCEPDVSAFYDKAIMGLEKIGTETAPVESTEKPTIFKRTWSWLMGETSQNEMSQEKIDEPVVEETVVQKTAQQQENPGFMSRAWSWVSSIF